MGRLRRGFAVVFLFSIAVNVLALTTSLYMLQLSDRVLSSRSVDTLIMLSVVAVGGIVVYGLLDVVRRFALTRLALGLEADLGANLLATGLSVEQQGGSFDTQALRDLQTIRGYVSGPVLPLIFDAPLAPFYALIVWLIHPQLGWIMLCGAVALVGLAIANKVLTAIPLAQASKYSMDAMTRAQSQARNSEVVLAMGMIDDCVKVWGRMNADALKAQAKAYDCNSLISGGSKIVRMLLQIAMLGWGAWLALNGYITGGAMVVSSMIAARGLQPIEGSIEGWRATAQAREAYARIRKLLTEKDVTKERLQLAPPQGQLDVENVTYIPRGAQKAVLQSISFSLAPGEALAVIGPSGAGKSTLMRVLVGTLRPTSGKVRLDGTDIRNWDRRQLGAYIGYLPQSVELFPGSIASNIARMQADASSDLVLAAARLANVLDVVNRLADGFNMEIGFDGAPLSGGQKQRVALARAFYNQPSFVVLDEPNSNLDGQGEQALIAAIENAKRAGMTVVAVTQRPSLLRVANKILMLKDGRVEKFGPAMDVLAALRVPKSGGVR